MCHFRPPLRRSSAEAGLRLFLDKGGDERGKREVVDGRRGGTRVDRSIFLRPHDAFLLFDLIAFRPFPPRPKNFQIESIVVSRVAACGNARGAGNVLSWDYF